MKEKSQSMNSILKLL